MGTSEGSTPVYDNYGPVSYPVAEGEALGAVRGEAIATPPYRKPRGTTDRSIANIKRYRKENPDAIRRWDTTYGCVVAFWGMRVYYGTCQSCGGLVTSRRPMAYHGTTGRWPKNCPECSRRKAEDHDDRARYRMRKLRGRYGGWLPRQDELQESADRFPAWKSLLRKPLGIWCLDCGEQIRITALRDTPSRPR